ncbi:MAG: imidazole glycerol phosphate synthase subunit HisH [Clostridiales bacterium]|jgi:glutamine amidotransferase|nr:imidazole glycerol phosphate synthase subunit HisH [Clostridiales bacterium]
MVSIINYKAGNAPSVLNAYNMLGIEAKLIESPEDVLGAEKLILPGVGSAGATMDSLGGMGVIGPIKYMLKEKKINFLGICIGLQVLFEFSEEGNVGCLGLLKGKVKKFDAGAMRVPQIGWNKAVFLDSDEINKNLEAHEYFYFVNSYYVDPSEKGDVFAETDYGGVFTSMVRHENIYAAQFHAEKSGEAGLTLLKNFAGLKNS